jgi:hypothetical protein
MPSKNPDFTFHSMLSHPSLESNILLLYPTYLPASRAIPPIDAPNIVPTLSITPYRWYSRVAAL